jgi:hypothetical protein
MNVVGVGPVDGYATADSVPDVENDAGQLVLGMLLLNHDIMKLRSPKRCPKR